MLTLKRLKEMEPDTIFSRGKLIDDDIGININRSGELFKRVAKRGIIHDRTIYYGPDNLSYDEVERFGDKIFDNNNIKRLINCDDEALKMYRK